MASSTEGMAPVPAGTTPYEYPAGRSWWERHGQSVLVGVGRLVLLGLVLGIWQLISGWLLSPLFISKPTAIAGQLGTWASDGTLAINTAITVQEIVLGFLFGAAVGIAAGFLVASVDFIGRLIDPYVMALYSIPKVALAPLFIVWIGIGTNMKVLLAAATVFFLVFLNTAAGVRQVDRGLVDAGRLMGASRRQLVLKVMLPGAMGGVITGLRLGVPYALIGAVVGELVASNHGLGYLISDSASRFNTAGVFAALFVLGVIALLINVLVNLLERVTSKWKASGSSR